MLKNKTKEKDVTRKNSYHDKLLYLLRVQMIRRIQINLNEIEMVRSDFSK